MLIYLVIIIAALCVLHLLLVFNSKARMIRKIPGPKDAFIVGNALELITTPVELFNLGRNYAKKWNGIYRFCMFHIGNVNIFNPEDIETVISAMKHTEKSNFYAFLRPWLGDGLLLSSGAKWHHRRKILTPTFHFNILKQFYAILDENSQRLVERLEKDLGKSVDVVPILSDFTLNSICETAMGTRLDEEASKSGRTYKQTIYSLAKLIVERFSRIYLYSGLIFNLTSLAKKQNLYVKTIREFTGKVIQERKDCASEHGSQIVENETDRDFNLNYKKKRTAMLDFLISAEKDGLIDSSGIQEEVETFMFEGHDTTAAGLTFCLMLLANNKQSQDKIVAEMKEELGDATKRIKIEDLPKLKYLDRCIKESLRLYPPVYFISRILDSTVKLSNYTVPAGTYCHIQIYDLHRREDLFKDASVFDPDRFLPENSIGRHPYSYIPFSAGPRNCIGQKFAVLEMKAAVAAVLQNYELLPVTTPDDVQIRADLVMRNNGPMRVKFAKRDK